MQNREVFHIFHFIYFHRDDPGMSTDSSQVGVALSPSCYDIFYHFTFPHFPFILKRDFKIYR